VPETVSYVKIWSEREVQQHSPPSKAKIENVWSIASILPKRKYSAVLSSRDNFPKLNKYFHSDLILVRFGSRAKVLGSDLNTFLYCTAIRIE
jgi:hypothetical protein